MYSIKVQPMGESEPVIDRSLSSNNAIETIPIVVEICRAEINMTNPVALYMGDNVYRIFDLDFPCSYVKVSIIKNAN